MKYEISDAERLARAVLLFHSMSPWTAEHAKIWHALTGKSSATTKILCDLARRIRTDAEQDRPSRQRKPPPLNPHFEKLMLGECPKIMDWNMDWNAVRESLLPLLRNFAQRVYCEWELSGRPSVVKFAKQLGWNKSKAEYWLDAGKFYCDRRWRPGRKRNPYV